MRKFIFGTILISILFSNSCQELVKDKVIIGVKVYNHEGDLSELFKEWDRTGINLILASPELARKNDFMKLAKEYSKRVFLIVPTFFNPEALDQDSTLYAVTRYGEPAIDDWVRFVCPNNENYRTKHIEYLKKLTTEIQPDGISIDFMRYFVFWEKVFPDHIFTDLPQTCFDDNCLEKFMQECDREFPDSCNNINKKANFILSQCETEWIHFKCQTISEFVTEMVETIKSVQPETEINFHAVPWRSADFEGGQRTIAGQDLTMIAPSVDYISPMCYSHMVMQPPQWVHSVVLDFDTQVPGSRILPSIQVNKAYLEASFSEKNFKSALIESLKPPSSGVIFWSWEALEKSPEKLKIVRDYLQDN